MLERIGFAASPLRTPLAQSSDPSRCPGSLSCLTSCLPQGLVEEAPREGRGGGFLEREEVVQYKSSRFQDDEDKSVMMRLLLLLVPRSCSVSVFASFHVLMPWLSRVVLSPAGTTTWAA